MKFVLENTLLLTDLASERRFWQYQPNDTLLARFQQQNPVLAGKKILEAPGWGLVALNCPNEPHLGLHLPLPRGQETHISVGRALYPVHPGLPGGSVDSTLSRVLGYKVRGRLKRGICFFSLNFWVFFFPHAGRIIVEQQQTDILVGREKLLWK